MLIQYSSDANYVSLSYRKQASSDRGRGAFVLGSLDEGQIPAGPTDGAEPEHGAPHPGHSPKVKD